MNALTWITKEAKRLRKEYPKRFDTWREYVSQASAIYASKHKGKSPVGHKHKHKKRRVGSVKKKSTRKKTISRVRKYHAAEGRALRSLGSVSYHVHHAKSQILEQIGKEEAKKYAAKTKRVKKKIGKKVSELKSKFRKLC